MNQHTTTMIAKTTYHSEEPLPENNAVVPVPVEDRLDFGDGTSFIFRFMPVNNGEYWEVDILKLPDYGIMPTDEQSTHKQKSERQDCEYKISFKDPLAIHSKDQAKKLAKSWAIQTWSYINKGVLF